MTKNVHRFLLGAAAIALLVATVLGAYGTHGLRDTLTAAAWDSYETAIAYQFYHGLGLIGTTLIAERYPGSRLIALSGWLLLAGIIVFCGSIYATTLGAPAAVGSVAPLGGMAFMLGWLALGVGLVRTRA
jgi:uncharacterized membrane protein YgdD (TMEM256/DUF423 family)